MSLFSDPGIIHSIDCDKCLELALNRFFSPRSCTHSSSTNCFHGIDNIVYGDATHANEKDGTPVSKLFQFLVGTRNVRTAPIGNILPWSICPDFP